MKKTLFFVLFITSCWSAFGQPSTISGEDCRVYFMEAESAGKKSFGLWGKDLYGPILLIDTDTRILYANMPDKEGLLRRSGDIYTGVFPENRIYANTALGFGGVEWAMIMLPLPTDEYARTSLILHERFHVLQSELGYTMHNPENNHLNEKDGRIYLRLELEALRAALNAGHGDEVGNHLGNALAFRKFRHSIYPGSGDTENKLELNEGLAEYTGEAACGRPDSGKAGYFSGAIDRFYRNPSFVRSFAYQTIPIYGYLLDRTDAGWNRKVTDDTDLTEFFIDAFGVTIPVNNKDVSSLLDGKYDSEKIISEETERHKKVKEAEEMYLRIFVEEPVLNIYLEDMQIQFDPRNITPLSNYGSVYPFMNVIDNWGSLKSGKAALLSADWQKLTLSAPAIIEGASVSGDGWTIELNDGYSIRRDESTGNYSIVNTK